GPFPASISACATQLRTADSVRPRSLDRAPMVLSPWRTNPTTSALYSFVNVRLALLPMWTPSGIFAFFGVSTKAGQDHGRNLDFKASYHLTLWIVRVGSASDAFELAGKEVGG